MVQEKVTKEELREMRIGQTRIITLTDRRKLNSARVTAQHVKNEEGMEFKDIVCGRTDGCRFCFFFLCEEGASAVEEVVEVEDSWERCTNFHEEIVGEVSL